MSVTVEPAAPLPHDVTMNEATGTRRAPRASSVSLVTKPSHAESRYPAIPVGPRLEAVLELAYRARRPVLLEGPTGIGKSDVVRHVAAKLGARGEQLIAPSASSIAALAYLVVFGSMLAYSAFGYLLRNTRPALATSYAYVNPVMALALGVALAGERVTRADLFGLALVLAAVALVALGSRSVRREVPSTTGVEILHRSRTRSG